jgi:D-alanyl-D-alanine carboxypeptidase
MRFFCLFLPILLLFSCFVPKSGKGETVAMVNVKDDTNGEDVSSAKSGGETRLALVMRNAQLPEPLINSLQATGNPTFIADLYRCLEGDWHLRELVDKQHPLLPDYVPDDLVTLTDGTYRVNRPGMMLRETAEKSLSEMAAAASADGVSLVVSSAYRSYAYQDEVYNRIVREIGREAADRESAQPGHSQHQTGLVLDFGSIDDSFAQTTAGRWMAANASRFGWSLSFPDGYESVTGYRWESWHFRYVGRDIAAFIDNYFGGIQQYALRFLYEWTAEHN